MTHRKWTAADVTEEDCLFFRDKLEDHFSAENMDLKQVSWLIAAIWNRLEEKRASCCGPLWHLMNDVLLVQALEALRESLPLAVDAFAKSVDWFEEHPSEYQSVAERDTRSELLTKHKEAIAALERMLTDFGSHHIKVEQYREAESALRAACGSDSVESERQDPFFDADHLAEVGAYMEERERKKLLAQALEALRRIASFGNLSIGKYWVEAMENAKEAIAALEKEVSQ